MLVFNQVAAQGLKFGKILISDAGGPQAGFQPVQQVRYVMLKFCPLGRSKLSGMLVEQLMLFVRHVQNVLLVQVFDAAQKIIKVVSHIRYHTG